MGFSLSLSFYICSASAPTLGLSTFDLFTSDKVFDNWIILSNVVEPIDELNSEALAS